MSQERKLLNRRGDVVLITYREYVLKDGREVLLSEVKDPIAVVIGGPGLHPAVAAELATMSEGETRTVVIDGRPFFGVPDPANIVKVPREPLEAMLGELRPGATLQLGGRVGTVKEVKEDHVVIDFNHPYAGLNVYSRVTLVKKLSDPEEEAKALVRSIFGYYADAIQVSVSKSRVVVATSPDVLLLGDLAARLAALNASLSMALPNRTVTFVITPEVVSGRVPRYWRGCITKLSKGSGDGKAEGS